MSHRIPLELIQIQNPCPASWDEMHGDDRVRFCDHCKLNVYNLSGMTRKAAETLVASREGRMCVQLYRRADGAVVTKDCGRLRAAAERAARFAGRSTVAVFSVALLPLIYCAPAEIAAGARSALRNIESWITQCFPGTTRAAGGMPAPGTVMGDVAVPARGEIAPATQPTMGKISAPVQPR